MESYIAAIDQGTSSTRCMLFNHFGAIVSASQVEHNQYFPKPGWVEHDAAEIWQNTQSVIRDSIKKARVSAKAIVAVGITNQRETTVIWNRRTGKPYNPAIVWQDTRTEGVCESLRRRIGEAAIRKITGLPVATYFSAPKIRWLLENVDGLNEEARKGDALFGNIDSWLIWNLTGGIEGGKHVTDVTNASRTMLLDLETLQWDKALAEGMGIPLKMLPRIRPSSDSDLYGYTTTQGPFGGRVPLCGDLGDQQAAAVGQTCFNFGDTKNTYGTGCFLVQNTGPKIISSKHGLISTVCYQFNDEPVAYALEGSVAIAGALIQWLRDNLQLFDSAPEVESLAKTVDDNGDVYFVPAFSGLFAPYWKENARGLIIGLTRFNNRGHIARAALEASAYQTRDIIEAMQLDSGIKLRELRVDGGMITNQLLMQFLADQLDIPIICPQVSETTALGAAYAAGLAIGYWKDLDEIRSIWKFKKAWTPGSEKHAHSQYYLKWKNAVARTYDWA